ncbi:enoyl-CoA hydratase/isomerase family protein [Aeromicrobium wangtongii]|uniref:enoyl-CoA hydratase/isomerase family protein n=1 Tax=Aeromicrobium wangtongii TaxID=2969247 RepID=UPI002016BD63|nr:enoyl-CoA hydratase/isomerase family protein [Aeromicrobium wangtongii]MCL3819597.1 enoyl-CoA hydratase/isomerase family protein [Aeromicrobium wangtongii]
MSLRVSKQGRLVDMVLDRPPVNALDGETYDALARAFDDAEPEDVLVLRSAARHFCTGQDLAEHQADKTAEQAAADLRRGAAAVIAALRCRAPFVAAVHGGAIGAGALLACAADVLIASEDAWFGLPELQVGVTIGGAVAERTLGGPLTRRMLLTGERIGAAQVATLGGARLVARHELARTAQEAAQTIAGLEQPLVALARRTWGNDERESAAAAYEAEIEQFLSR